MGIRTKISLRLYMKYAEKHKNMYLYRPITEKFL